MPERDDSMQMRAADADRDAVAARLRDAVAEGRLDLDELDERLGATFAAKTYAELDAIAADLPPVGAGRQKLPPSQRLDGLTPDQQAEANTPIRLSAGGSTRRKEGVWIVPSRMHLNAGLGDIKLDFSDAICPHDVVHIEANAWAGSVTLIVPAGWRVNLDRVSASMGDVNDKVKAPYQAGKPTLVVSGHAAMGSVTARHARTSRFLPK